ncbi:MAG TPA: class IV adenylate cyclase [Candidatus Acidoferrales bacterium]
MRVRGRETEIKLAVARPADVRKLLRRAGFRVRHRRSFEHNLVFDTADRSLVRRGCLLRLRTYAGAHSLTFKRPGQVSSRFKVREELETAVERPGVLREVLAALGLEPVFRYEKYRTVFESRGRWRGGEVMLDETPIGPYVELEGGRDWIRRAARDLFSAGPDRFIVKNYAALYIDWCRERGAPFGDMVFSSRRRGFALKT